MRARAESLVVGLLLFVPPERVVVGSQPVGVIASTLIPSIQFSNLATIDSTLSGSRIDGFKTFTSSGWAVHANLSVGYFVRF
jgi:hypothetical protein